MFLERLAIPEIIHIEPRKFIDHRGYFTESFRDDWSELGIGIGGFIQDNQSLSVDSGTIRGLHFQTGRFAQGKLVRCVAGALFDVAVDIRRGSPSYGAWVGVELTADRGNQLWIPPGFAHGFCTLRPDTILCYKVSAYYSAEHDKGIAWHDPAIAIAWPEVADPTLLSEKDRQLPLLADTPAYFSWSAM
ncbi:dTDP-4-dehydrorhamnose 3,5-epimerase [Sphingomonas sp. HH69]